MATRKQFWEDPYLRESDARVAAVDGDSVTLDRTIFYAESGGQESDRGTIGGREVLEARRHGAEIAYALAPGHGLAAGDEVLVAIDWPRRYRLMRLHFAAEVVLELAYRAFPGIEKIGAHIGEDRARVDFTWPQPLTPALPGLLERATAIFERDLPVTSAFSDAARERRYWEVEGFARVACGGTHLRRTGEVGRIELKRRNVGRDKERVEITLRD